ncbi:MAG: efflux RND transporter permease subunit, partial [Candidatus Absconditicoccaceae bacterium]
MINFLKKNKLVIIILTTFLGLYGFYSLMTITKEVTPSVNIPYYNIVVTYPGADSKTIEEQVTSKLEQKFKAINFLKKITSTTSYNFAVITLEFMTQKNNNDAINDIKSAIDQIYATLPSDVKYPSVKKVDISDSPMYVFSVASKNSLETLYPRISPLEDNIKSVKGVSDVSIIGKPQKTIKINFDFAKIAENNLDIGMIIGQLRSSFLKLPTDKKQIQNTLYSFEISTYENDIQKIIQQVKDFEIFNIGGKTLRVSDIATVKFGYKGSQQKSFLFFSGDTVNAISFQVKKVPGYDVNDVTLNLKNKIQEYSKQNPDLQVIEIQSSEESIKKIYNLFFENFLETGLLVLLVILVFLGFRPSLLIVFSFVLVYLINFLVFKASGSSFNNIVSFGLILILGIMIDNLIVVTQGIIVGYRETGNMWGAIEFSLKNYSRPIIFGTLTTIAIFLPMYFGLTGIIGEFMKPFPFTVTTNLSISLIVSLVILPVLFATFLSKTKLKEVQSMVFLEHLGKRMGNFFFKSNQKKSGSVGLMSIFWVLFVFAFILMGLGVIKIDFLGNSDSENIWINMQYTPGISTMQNQEYTNTITQEVGSYVNQKYGKTIEYIEVSIGSLGLQQGQKDPSNIASLSIKLVPFKDRNIKSYVMNEQLQSYVKTIKPKYK